LPLGFCLGGWSSCSVARLDAGHLCSQSLTSIDWWAACHVRNSQLQLLGSGALRLAVSSEQSTICIWAWTQPLSPQMRTGNPATLQRFRTVDHIGSYKTDSPVTLQARGKERMCSGGCTRECAGGSGRPRERRNALNYWRGRESRPEGRAFAKGNRVYMWYCVRNNCSAYLLPRYVGLNIMGIF